MNNNFVGYPVFGPTLEQCEGRREQIKFCVIHGRLRSQEKFDWAYATLNITPSQAILVGLEWADVKQFCIDTHTPMPDWLRETFVGWKGT